FLGTNATTGFVTSGANTRALQPGQLGFIKAPGKGVDGDTANPDAIVDPATVGTGCTPLVLVQGSIYQNDKIGPFAGGYKETTKSKIINPKYVTGFWSVPSCALRQESISVGDTSDTLITPNISPCVDDFDFKCGETYYLRLDIKGSPSLRYLSRNDYFTASAYTGCCATPGVSASVNPLIVYINWAYQLLNSPLINPFIRIKIQYGTNGASTLSPAGLVTAGWFTSAPGDLALLNAYILDNTTIPSAPSAGFIIQGAYVDTQFGDCTFYPTDALQAYLEPVKLFASMVDYNGDPCAFTGVCVKNTCLGRQGQGFGETVLRDLILSEAYGQTPFYTGRDLRIREITQGNQLMGAAPAISRTAQYDRVFIQHSVPRFNNPTGTFDNDQYVLEVIFPTGSASLTAFTNAVTGWLTDAGSPCTALLAYGCEPAISNCTLAALT
ncbi:hypothetical protein EBU95_20975, partial [bacterium]|nr:hypothetical protein [bacterium]